MNIRCLSCDTINQLSTAELKKTANCSNCGQELDTVAVATATENNSMFVVCSFCQKGFYIPSNTDEHITRCISCGKDIDLCQGGETMVMSGINLPDAFMQESVLSQGDRRPEQEKKTNENSSPGTMFGSYRLLKAVDNSSLGIIYHGEQVNLKRKVAIFVLDSKLADNPDIVAAFLQKARQTASLVHPHIARVYDVGSESNNHFIVSELVTGESLASRISSGPLKLIDIVNMAAETAQALSAGAKAGIMHGGLTPNNIYFDKRGKVKVLHFGITSSLFGQNQNQIKFPRTQIKFPQEVLAFLAPELFFGKQITEGADIFSLGVIIYLALTCKRPYTNTEIEQLYAGKGLPLTPNIPNLFPEISRQMTQLLQKMLEIKLKARADSCSEIVAQFAAIAKSMPKEGSSAEKHSSGHNADLPPERRRIYKRLPINLGAKISIENVDDVTRNEYLSKLKDISENGAFVLTARPSETNSFIRLEINLEGSKNRVNILGIVRWRDLTPGNIGMGIQFIEVSTSNRKQLSKFVSERSVEEVIQALTVSTLHKTVVKYLARHFGETIKISNIMRGTGASRILLDRALSDIQNIGLIEIKDKEVNCKVPHDRSLRRAIERIVGVLH